MLKTRTPKENAELLLSYFLCRCWEAIPDGLTFTNKALNNSLGFEDDELQGALNLLVYYKVIKKIVINSKYTDGFVTSYIVNPIYLQKLKHIWFTPRHYEINQEVTLIERATDNFLLNKSVIVDAQGLNIKYSQYQLNWLYEGLANLGIKDKTRIINHIISKISNSEFTTVKPQPQPKPQPEPIVIPPDVIYAFKQYDLTNEQEWDEVIDVLDKYYYDELQKWREIYLFGYKETSISKT